MRKHETKCNFEFKGALLARYIEKEAMAEVQEAYLSIFQLCSGIE